MSTFDGVIKEYPLISIDNFVKECKNYESTVFLLSHCHSDHMNGLGHKNFLKLLNSRGFSKIYLSEVSEHLLKNDDFYSPLSKHLVPLPLEEPQIITIPDEKGNSHSTVVITLLTAGHCPGSVMFLIEGSNGRVLYTGDFRLPEGSAARLTCLHNEFGQLETIDSLYIDTTFCKEKCLYIPTREQCLDTIFSLVEPWLKMGPDYIIHFICPAQYAYEFVFVELFKKLGEKTHVTEKKLRKYRGIKMIEEAVTSDPIEARIHACTYEEKDVHKIYKTKTFCGYYSMNHNLIYVRTIKPSAMFFTMNNFINICDSNESREFHRVCYSTHSSLAEIRDMAKYLKPKVIRPNVVRNQTEQEILDIINTLIICDSDDTSLESSILGPLKDPNIKNLSSSCEGTLSFDDDCYNISVKNKSMKNVIVGQAIELFKDEILSEVEGIPSTIPNICTTEPQKQNSCEKYINSDTTKGSMIENDGGIKWDYQLPSSDDENINPNSPLQSQKSRAESSSLFESSEEQDIERADEGLLLPCSDVPKCSRKLIPDTCVSNVASNSKCRSNEEKQLKCTVDKCQKEDSYSLLESNYSSDSPDQKDMNMTQPDLHGMRSNISALLSLIKADSSQRSISEINSQNEKNTITTPTRPTWRRNKLELDIPYDDSMVIGQICIDNKETFRNLGGSFNYQKQHRKEFNNEMASAQNLTEKFIAEFSPDIKVHSYTKEVSDINSINDTVSCDEVVCITGKNHRRNEIKNSEGLPNKSFYSKSYRYDTSDCSMNSARTRIDAHTSPQLFFPNPDRDISASKFKWTYSKSRKKESPSQVALDESIIILTPPPKNSRSSQIEVIDLSSDDSLSEENNSQTTEKSRDEVLELSPSLLSVASSSRRVSSVFPYKKRKSLEQDGSEQKKSPKLF